MNNIYQRIRKVNEPGASLLLLLLLSSDFAFNMIHIIKHTLAPSSSLWSVQLSAYLDIYHLVKLFWVIILFACILKSTRYSGYVSWMLVFTFFLLDDALLLHQNIGDQIANGLDAYLQHNLDLQPRLFELAVLAIAGFSLLSLVAWAYFHSLPAFRKVSKDLLLFLAALVFFGLIVDLASAIKLGPSVLLGLEIVEDGGEMVVLSLILWYVFLLAIRSGKTDSLEGKNDQANRQHRQRAEIIGSIQPGR